MTIAAALFITAGAFAGGFVTGLAGFGTGLVALGIWLHVLAPTPAATLTAICSVVAQSQTLPQMRHVIDLRRIWPIVLAGLLGVPIGVLLLTHIDPGALRLAIGVFLVLFSAVMLSGRANLAIRWGGRAADTGVGFCGGILGGLTGLSGPLPTLWATLRGWGKDQRRGLFQAYNLVVLAATTAIHAADGLVTAEIGWLLLWALPGTILGSWLGARAYHRLSDRRFDQIILVLLGLSGATLVWPYLV